MASMKTKHLISLVSFSAIAVVLLSSLRLTAQSTGSPEPRVGKKCNVTLTESTATNKTSITGVFVEEKGEWIVIKGSREEDRWIRSENIATMVFYPQQ